MATMHTRLQLALWEREFRMMMNAANVGTGFTRTVEWIAVGTHP